MPQRTAVTPLTTTPLCAPRSRPHAPAVVHVPLQRVCQPQVHHAGVHQPWAADCAGPPLLQLARGRDHCHVCGQHEPAQYGGGDAHVPRGWQHGVLPGVCEEACSGVALSVLVRACFRVPAWPPLAARFTPWLCHLLIPHPLLHAGQYQQLSGGLQAPPDSMGAPHLTPTPPPPTTAPTTGQDQQLPGLVQLPDDARVHHRCAAVCLCAESNSQKKRVAGLAVLLPAQCRAR